MKDYLEKIIVDTEGNIRDSSVKAFSQAVMENKKLKKEESKDLQRARAETNFIKQKQIASEMNLFSQTSVHNRPNVLPPEENSSRSLLESSDSDSDVGVETLTKDQQNFTLPGTFSHKLPSKFDICLLISTAYTILLRIVVAYILIFLKNYT